MSDSITITSSVPIPLPETNLIIRPGVMDDLPFIDYLQKKNNKQVGFFPTKAIEGKIKLGHVLIATRPDGVIHVSENDPTDCDTKLRHERRVGYLIGNDQYFKRDDVGCIFQINVANGNRRRLVAASLLKAQFARSAYGCKLYCCWCAQDIEANKFWESMGFVPLAYRVGSELKGPKDEHGKRTPRVHIFWQKRIRSGDVSTPWWFPSKTAGGAIREDRIVLPIPPGTHWRDAKPLILPGAEMPAIEAPEAEKEKKPRAAKKAVEIETPAPLRRNGLMFDIPQIGEPLAQAKPAKAAKPKAEKIKRACDPQLVAAARELRDRWLEHVNAQPLAAIAGKYDVNRAIETDIRVESSARSLPTPSRRLLAA